ncbi:MAG: CvpA family protein [Cytophagales bacterium]|nr:CvpA family protein [Cytophagales bacterium]
MNYVDIFLLVILVLGAIRGYSKGLIIELFSLIAFFFGLFGAIKFSGPIAAIFFGDSDFYLIGLVGVFIVLFIALSVVINLIAKLIKKGVDLIFLGWFDNLLGGILGILKWGFLVSMLVLMLKGGGLLLPEKDLAKSRIYPYIEDIGPNAFNALETIFPFFENFIDSIDEEKNKHFV